MKILLNKIRGWNIVKTTENGQEYIISTTLSEGPKSKATAVFFRNKHDTSGDYIVSLKISRNNKLSNGLLQYKPEKTITLSNDELDELLNYIEKNYSALSMGEDSYISLDESNLSKVLKQIAELGVSAQDLLEKLYDSGILNSNLAVAIVATERKRALEEFELALNQKKAESYWQKWFSANKWILGSEYLRILDERDIDEHHRADYLMQSNDSFLDIVEIKRPDLRFWLEEDSHHNLNPAGDLVSAITQCLNYLYRIERKSDSDDFRQRVDNVRTVKPQCLLVYGRSNNWGSKQLESYRILNSAYNQIKIVTYDQLLIRAKNLLGVDNIANNDSSDLDDGTPF